MTTCKGCGRDMDRQSTHWEGCHEHHPECASYREGFKAGREAGMRRAAEICQSLIVGADGKPHLPATRHVDWTAEYLAKTILAEADK